VLGDSIRRRRPVTDRKDAEPGGRRSSSLDVRAAPSWLRWLGLALLVIVASFFAGYLLATRVFFPPPVTAGVGIAVPDLYGMDRASAERAIVGLGLRVGSVREVPSMRTQSGRIVAQEPVPEQQLRPGAEVSLAVSTGPPEVRVPAVTGLGAGTARDLLETAGFDVSVQPVRAPGPQDTAVRTEPDAGSLVRLPALITLFVNLVPEEVDPVDEPDAAPGEPQWP
jgi:beta-lactam-binding protein with PASTA domain